MAHRKPINPLRASGTPTEHPQAPDPSIRSGLFAAISGPERYTLFANDISRAFEVSVDHARRALRAIHDPSSWIAGALPGSRMIAMPELKRAAVVVAELPLGMHIPIHAHAERELTFILDGELLDDTGRTFGAGDLIEMRVGTLHSISVVGKHACLAVFRGATR